jgi:hypothetical protein
VASRVAEGDEGSELALDTAAVRSRGIYCTPASTVTKVTSQSSPDRQCSSYDNEIGSLSMDVLPLVGPQSRPCAVARQSFPQWPRRSHAEIPRIAAGRDECRAPEPSDFPDSCLAAFIIWREFYPMAP